VTAPKKDPTLPRKLERLAYVAARKVVTPEEIALAYTFLESAPDSVLPSDHMVTCLLQRFENDPHKASAICMRIEAAVALGDLLEASLAGLPDDVAWSIIAEAPLVLDGFDSSFDRAAWLEAVDQCRSRLLG